MRQRPPEPVELPDHQHIAGPQRGEAAFQFWALARRARGRVGEDMAAAIVFRRDYFCLKNIRLLD
jgi:hypothetical protein